MMNVPGYHINELLHEGTHSRLYRAHRLQDDAPVVLKLPSAKLPTEEQREQFRREYELTRKLQLEEVIAAHDLEWHQGMPVMILEDIGGASLDNLDIAARLPIAEFLRLALRITECLGQLHRQRIIHKDINPSNIVWNRQTGQVKLIDLGLATELSREHPESCNPQYLEGTLSYMAPEQTGRMNRAVDHRTDFYSLGVTFYQLLTGQLPFPMDDPMALVHAHIAQTPPPADRVNPRLPAMLGAIVAKLMAKTAEERYQSAAGLASDLRTCLENLDANEQIAAFSLGGNDFSDRLQISQTLYGRDTQIAALLAAFERATSGRAELFLVAGYSGIGKSAVVHEIRKPITHKSGYFIEGKFDQFKRDIPYASLTQAFRELVRQLLTEDEAVIRQWREKLLQALGNNGQVIIDVIPDVEFLVGPQPAVPALPPEQAQNRFNHEFRNFVSAIASSEHPLVIFLDDLQWADLPSLQLMSLLLRSPDSLHLLLIGAYRDNEITPSHPLSAMLKDMEKAGAVAHTATLPPLALAEVTQLVCDTLRTDAARAEQLARLCFDKTQGNPFFLSEFLATLADRRMLRLDAAHGGWQWDIDSIRQADITDNVIELMLEKLKRLPVSTQRILQAAACLGNTFELKMLAIVCQLPEHDTAQLLWNGLTEGLIVPLDEHYKYAAQVGDGHATPSYRFQHDRVQQAAYLLGGKSDKPALHLAIGRLWLKAFSSAEREDMLFDLVNHLNLGRALITEPAERFELAQLNAAAAQRAKASAAYRPALSFLQVALELVSEQDWDGRYEFMLALHLAAAEAAYLSIDFDCMERYIGNVLTHTADPVDQAKAHEITIQAFISQGRFLDALHKGLDVLDLLGMGLPRKANKLHVIASVIQTKIALTGKKAEDLEQLPRMQDPRILAASNILLKIGSAAYATMPIYMPLVPMKAIRLTLKHGLAPTSIYPFAAYGLVLGSVLGNIKQQAYYGELALRLLELPIAGMEVYKCRTRVVVHALIQPWTMPLQQTLEPVRDDHLFGMEIGDMEFAARAAQFHAILGFYGGRELKELEKETAAYCDTVGKIQQPSSHISLKILWQTLLNLRGESAEPRVFGGSVCDQDQVREWESHTDKRVLLQLFSMKLLLSYLFGDYRAAADHGAHAAQYADATPGVFTTGIFFFYHALAQAALLAEATPREQARLLHEIKRSQKKLRHWADHAPSNFLHKWYLVEAEVARCTGKTARAADCYAQAIRLAGENNFLQEEALACELAGEFYLMQEHDALARDCITKAHSCYRRWSADAKADDLANRYPQWLEEPKAVRVPIGLADGTASTIQVDASGLLDFGTVMKASQALSQEIVLERLLKRLMAIAIENAGAQRGILLLREEDRWYIEAEKTGEQAEAAVLQSLPLNEADQGMMSFSLVHYVMRSKQSIVIHDALTDSLLANDVYVRRCQPRSLLAMPILHQGEMIGLLYLENNAASGAFTEDRLEVLRLLSSQTAISIENARLYADMEERVAARTAEVVQQKEMVEQAMKELKNTQQQLVFQEKMASVGTLTAGVAHEINNPANFAHVGAQALETDLERFRRFLLELAGEDADTDVLETLNQHIDGLVKQVDTIVEGTSRIRDLVKDLRTFSRLDEAEKKAVSIVHSLTSTIQLVRTQYAQSVDIRCQLDADPVLECWPAQLNQVFMNLIVNACHAIQEKQRRTGDAAPGVLDIRSRIDGTHLVLEFEDSGCGIPQNVIDRIFEPFFTTKEVGEGTGLGLSISFGIIEKHEGRIEVRSVEGEGSCFTLHLPLALASHHS